MTQTNPMVSDTNAVPSNDSRTKRYIIWYIIQTILVVIGIAAIGLLSVISYQNQESVWQDTTTQTQTIEERSEDYQLEFDDQTGDLEFADEYTEDQISSEAEDTELQPLQIVIILMVLVFMSVLGISNIVGFVLFLMWLHRMHQNGERIANKKFFIPAGGHISLYIIPPAVSLILIIPSIIPLIGIIFSSISQLVAFGCWILAMVVAYQVVSESSSRTARSLVIAQIVIPVLQTISFVVFFVVVFAVSALAPESQDVAQIFDQFMTMGIVGIAVLLSVAVLYVAQAVVFPLYVHYTNKGQNQRLVQK